jgi:hypothetical protein
MEPEYSLSCLQEPATGPDISQINPVYDFIPSFSKIHSNIILPHTSRSPE